MADEKRKPATDEDGRRKEDAPSKGQYGGLKGLGPGGGRDIAEAADTDDIGEEESARR